jgi:hypothetical protein
LSAAAVQCVWALAFTRRRQLRDYAAMKARDEADTPPSWPELKRPCKIVPTLSPNRRLARYV